MRIAAVFAMMVALVPSVAAAEVALVGDASEVHGCERRGEVRSSSMMGGILTSTGYKRSIERLKKKAEAMGATHVHLLNANSNYAGSNMIGVAYRCDRPPAG